MVAQATIVPTISVAGNVEGSIVIGDHNFVVNTNHGTIIYQQAAVRVQPRSMVPQPPRRPRGFVGRSRELAELNQFIISREIVQVFGSEGVGKSTLLKQAANSEVARALPNGVIFLEGVDEAGAALGMGDLIQCLFDALFESEPRLKVNLASARTYLSNTRPLVLLDNFSFASTHLAVLPDLFPQGAILFTSRQKRTDDVALPLKLDPLPRAEAIQLLAEKMGLTSADADQMELPALVALLGGVPLALITAANVIRENNLPLDQARQIISGCKPTSSHSVEAAIERAYALIKTVLSKDEQLALGLTAALPGVSVDSAWLPEPVVERLQALELLQANSPRLRLPPGLRPVIRQDVDEATVYNQLLVSLQQALSTQALNFEFCADELGNILGGIKWAASQERWAEIIALGRAIDPYLTLHGLWDAWRATLNQVLFAARQVGDRATEGWVLHQLGTREIGVGQPQPAATFLQQALEVRRSLGDRVGMAYTQHNLNLLLPPPPPPLQQTPPGTGPGPLMLSAATVAGIALVVIAALVVVAGLLGLALYTQAPAVAPIAQVLGFPSPTPLHPVNPSTPLPTLSPTPTPGSTSVPADTPQPAALLEPTATHTPLPTDTPVVSNPEGIFFYSDRDGDDIQLYGMNSDGSQPTPLVSITSRTAIECGLFAERLIYSPDGQQIAFVSDTDHGLYMMKADGSGLTRVADGVAGFVGDFAPSVSWSPDGTQLAFAEFLPLSSAYPVHRLYVVKSDGSELTQLMNEEAPPIWNLAWSPGGKQIAYNEFYMAGGDIGRIFIINADGSGESPLTDEDGIISQKDPAWSPDGKRILFWNSSDSLADQHPPGLNIANADGSGQVKLTGLTEEMEIRYDYGNSSIDFHASSPWSSDGSRIFFIEDNWSGATSLNVINSDGSGLTRLTDREDLTLGPVWSPDRTRFAYLAGTDQGQTNNLYVLNVAELQPIRPPATGNNLTDLVWSPDGSRLAYIAETSSSRDLYLINADGSGLTQLTRNAGFNEEPIWLFDGERLFFQSAARPGELRDIYTVKADGSELINLTNHPADDFFVSFRGCGR